MKSQLMKLLLIEIISMILYISHRLRTKMFNQLKQNMIFLDLLLMDLYRKLMKNY